MKSLMKAAAGLLAMAYAHDHADIDLDDLPDQCYGIALSDASDFGPY